MARNGPVVDAGLVVLVTGSGGLSGLLGGGLLSGGLLGGGLLSGGLLGSGLLGGGLLGGSLNGGLLGGSLGGSILGGSLGGGVLGRSLGGGILGGSLSGSSVGGVSRLVGSLVAGDSSHHKRQHQQRNKQILLHDVLSFLYKHNFRGLFLPKRVELYHTPEFLSRAFSPFFEKNDTIHIPFIGYSQFITRPRSLTLFSPRGLLFPSFSVIMVEVRPVRRNTSFS